MGRVFVFLFCACAVWLPIAPGWASEPVVEFTPCEQRRELQKQHPDDYRTRYFGARTGSDVRHNSSNLAEFFSEPAHAVRWVLPDKGSLEHVYEVRCDDLNVYSGNPFSPWRRVGYRDTSYALVLLPGMSFRSPPKQAMKLEGYSNEVRSHYVKITLDISRMTHPVEVMDPYAYQSISFKLQSQRAGTTTWSTLASPYYVLSKPQRLKRTVYAKIPAGPQRVRILVMAVSLSSKPISLGIHSVRLEGVRDFSDLRTEIAQLGWRGEQQIQIVNLRKLLHEQYTAGARGVLCSAVDTVDKLQEATEILLFEGFADPDEWRDSLEGGATFWIADSALYEAQLRGGIPEDVDPWAYLTDQRPAIDRTCSTHTSAPPSEEAFSNAGGQLRSLGISNAQAYHSAVSELSKLQKQALGLIQLIGASREDYLWTAITY